jgi:hypothetical protein
MTLMPPLTLMFGRGIAGLEVRFDASRSAFTVLGSVAIKCAKNQGFFGK